MTPNLTDHRGFASKIIVLFVFASALSQNSVVEMESILSQPGEN